jgi:hypothetical protein
MQLSVDHNVLMIRLLEAGKTLLARTIADLAEALQYRSKSNQM